MGDVQKSGRSTNDWLNLNYVQSESLFSAPFYGHFENLLRFLEMKTRFAEPPGNTKGSAKWWTVDLQEGRGNAVGWDHTTSHTPKQQTVEVPETWFR